VPRCAAPPDRRSPVGEPHHGLRPRWRFRHLGFGPSGRAPGRALPRVRAAPRPGGHDSEGPASPPCRRQARPGARIGEACAHVQGEPRLCRQLAAPYLHFQPSSRDRKLLAQLGRAPGAGIGGFDLRAGGCIGRGGRLRAFARRCARGNGAQSRPAGEYGTRRRQRLHRVRQLRAPAAAAIQLRCTR
jgi:hypothetical protein